MRVLLIFVDGIALGDNDPEKNPFARSKSDFFRYLFGGSLTSALGRRISTEACLVPTDACLGVGGLPQSATGQTTLLTGINAPQKMERHILGFPGPQLAGIISEHGIMRRLANDGYVVTSANMYTPDYMELVARRKRRHSATTLTIMGAGVPLRSMPEMEANKAVYQDITNELLTGLGYFVPVIRPARAAERLVSIAAEHDFTLFEYFQTDRCGHKQNMIWAESITEVLSEFFIAVHQAAPSDMLVIITSDHGNFEDLSVKTHTYNLVPTIAFGARCQEFSSSINALTDITPAIISILEGNDFL